MDEIYRLAKCGENHERGMKLVALECSARLVLEWFGKARRNEICGTLRPLLVLDG